MSTDKNQATQSLSEYLKNLSNQEIKVIILKLKNEIGKEDVAWDQIKPLLRNLLHKDENVLFDILPHILES